MRATQLLSLHRTSQTQNGTPHQPVQEQFTTHLKRPSTKSLPTNDHNTKAASIHQSETINQSEHPPRDLWSLSNLPRSFKTKFTKLQPRIHARSSYLSSSNEAACQAKCSCIEIAIWNEEIKDMLDSQMDAVVAQPRRLQTLHRPPIPHPAATRFPKQRPLATATRGHGEKPLVIHIVDLAASECAERAPLQDSPGIARF